jgi:integrase
MSTYVKLGDGFFQRGNRVVYTAHATDTNGATRMTWIDGGDTLAKAKKHREDMRAARRRNEWVAPNRKLTTGEWLDQWMATVAPNMRPGTVDLYRLIIRVHLKPALGRHRLQALQPTHVEQYFSERRSKLSGASLRLHGCVLSAALGSALRKKMVTHNVYALVDNKPSASDPRADAKKNVYDREQARKLIAAGVSLSPQLGALTAVAFDSGARKGELGALTWADVDLDKGTIMIDKTLTRQTKNDPVITGPTKTGRSRTIRLGAETVALLKAHRAEQAKTIMKNRRTYRDHNLVFACTWTDPTPLRSNRLGLPLKWHDINTREWATICKTADVPRRKFHSCRHTMATLALGAGEPVHAVSERLGHSKASMTLDVYSHAIPSQQQRVASTMNTVLFG